MIDSPREPEHALFAYGSLIVPPVLRAVTGLELEGIPALLPGYARFKLRGASYPGIVPSETSDVEGVLYTGIGDREFETLDRFEGDIYERVRVTVATADGAREAFTYVVPERHRESLSVDPWDLEEFIREDLIGFLSSLSSRMNGPKE